jgi:hypothetical protein
MSYFVLRQISPPRKSALAHEATLIALTLAAQEGNIVLGPYLEFSDPDARNGMGEDRWTDDISKAKRFATFTDAMECWKAQSKVHPFRSDGKPNRPLTAFSVQPQRIDDE